MAKTVRIETRQRSIFGKIFALLFWAFNAFMVTALVIGVKNGTEVAAGMTTDAEQAGAAIGATLGIGMLMSVWFFGAVILGLFSYMTRGKKVITETVEA